MKLPGSMQSSLMWKSSSAMRRVPAVTIYDADTDEPFLIASLKPEGAVFKFLLEGHLDVVSPEGMEKPFDGIIEDGYLCGRGVSDMKGGAAAQLAAFMAAANDDGLKQEIYLMFSTDEEYAGVEIKKALTEGTGCPKWILL